MLPHIGIALLKFFQPMKRKPDLPYSVIRVAVTDVKPGRGVIPIASKYAIEKNS